MRVLTLDRSGRLCFRERSSLPVSAACVVASGMRERLAALLRESVALRLLEPTIPTPRGWAAITGGARLYRVRGVISDAAVVLRSLDAAALARAAFGETVDPSACKRELSAIEIQVLDRAIASLAGALSAVCGPPEGESTAELVGEIAGFATYFELVLDRPVDARIGIALAREPVAQAHGHLEIEDLREV
ncbi:MAG TPA: hypothetical protein VNG31_08700, partial [Candidatus Baltobacteraceae bacterium]|nr:hypothetical protein [Candidatus Baltobacteraceae bacterium]